MNGRLVAFSGVDCAGKSTQIALLRQRIEADGKSVSVFWYRPGYSRELDALRAAIRRWRPGTLPAPGASSGGRRDAAFSRRRVRMTWVAMATVDMLLQYAIRVRRLMRTHDVVLSDRTLFDAECDLALRFPDLDWLWRPGVVLAARSMPRLDAHFFLDLDTDEIDRRQRAKREPFPDAPEVRAARYEYYERAACERPDVTIVDSSPSVPEVHEHIWRHLVDRGVVHEPA